MILTSRNITCQSILISVTISIAYCHYITASIKLHTKCNLTSEFHPVASNDYSKIHRPVFPSKAPCMQTESSMSRITFSNLRPAWLCCIHLYIFTHGTIFRKYYIKWKVYHDFHYNFSLIFFSDPQNTWRDRIQRSTVNLLKQTGHVMHQQFNIQQLYVLPTLYLCVLYLSENKQRLVPLTA